MKNGYVKLKKIGKTMMTNNIVISEKERDKCVEQLAYLNAEIEELEGKRGMLRYRIAELNGEIEEAQEDEVQIASEEVDAFQELLEGSDASALRTKYKTLNDIIDKSRLPGRDCSTWEARTQRRVVVARLEEIEQKES